MSVSLTLPAIEEFLQSLQLEPKVQEETQQISVILKIKGMEFPLFFNILEGAEHLQVIAFITKIPKRTTIPDLARLLHLFNREFTPPGLGMDEEASLVFYRLVLLGDSGQLPGKHLEMICKYIESILQTYARVIVDVAAGSLSFENLQRHLQE